jgi:hypothetical protein
MWIAVALDRPDDDRSNDQGAAEHPDDDGQNQIDHLNCPSCSSGIERSSAARFSAAERSKADAARSVANVARGQRRGGRPKAAREEPAGRTRVWYGDLVIADGRGSHWAGLIEVLSRLVGREIGRAWGSLRPRVCTLANVARSTVQVRESTG